MAKAREAMFMNVPGEAKFLPQWTPFLAILRTACMQISEVYDHKN